MASIQCNTSAAGQAPCTPRLPLPAPVEALLEIVRRYGTPTYAYDLDSIRGQAARLRAHLPASVDVVYSLKANPSLGLAGFLAGCGVGADVASAGELATALEARFAPERIFVSGPDKSPAMLSELERAPGALISIDSVSELRILASLPRPHRALLRLRPDFTSFASCSAGPDSRFGLIAEDFHACRSLLSSRRNDGGVRVIGFHVFAGSQVLDAGGIIQHMRGALDLALRAGNELGVTPEIINLGGGFGIVYGPDDSEMDLGVVGAELHALAERAERAAATRLMLELGRYLVAPSGWYLTTVIAQQTHHGRPALVVDGGTHQRGDMCGLALRHKAFAPTVLTGHGAPLVPTDVLGCLSLPSDVLAESCLLPSLSPGAVLAFPNAGAYGLAASPFNFHGHQASAEAAFTATTIELIRTRPRLRDLFQGQHLLGH
jgi:diaminopimelate decarboxylase